MKTILGTALFLASLASYGQVKPPVRKHVILPNPKIVRCTSSDCYQLWLDKPPDVLDIYPVDVRVALLGDPCPVGVAARYDKSVSFEDLQAALEERYGKGETKHWTDAPLMIWDVTAEKLQIQLETVDKRMAKAQRVDVGTKNIHITEAGPHTKCGYHETN